MRDAVGVGVAAVLAAPQRGVGLGGHGEGRAPVGGVIPGRAPPRRGEAGHGGAADGHLHTRHPDRHTRLGSILPSHRKRTADNILALL